jgi:DNA-binding NtrC family response regulator
MASVLVVDDDVGVRVNLQEILESEGHEVTSLITAEDALDFLRQDEPDLILLDFRLPGMDGIQCLSKIKKEHGNISVIMITSHANVDDAVKAMKLGAWDYIKKPFSIDEISLTIRKALESKLKDEHIAYLEKEKNTLLGFDEIIGASHQIQEIKKFISEVSSYPKTTVLIRGETGTGKELVARAIHKNSVRSLKPFIEVNCSAFQESLLEAELFGYEQGAFTGAVHRKKGLLELAHNGTFFLDEIGDMAATLQSKILRVLEEQKFRRVGGTREIYVDTRIISATSRDLEKSIGEGTFREDLFFRLNVAMIVLPPLRKRKDDVLLLADYFLTKFNAEFKKNIKGISKAVKERLMEHDWPGNVRELKNTMERAVLFERGEELSLYSLSLYHRGELKAMVDLPQAEDLQIPPEGISLMDMEKTLIENALKSTNGNQSKAAELLDISRETLKYRIKKFKIKLPNR